MKLSNDSAEKINNFLKCLDDLISENYLYIEQKINQMMNIASTSEEIYNLLKKNLSNSYNLSFQIEQSSASINNGKFSPPTKKKDFLEFTLSLLIEFGAKKRDYQQFLFENFIGETRKDIQNQFINIILKPFKEILMDYFQSLESEDEEPITTPSSLTDYSNINQKYFMKQIEDYIKDMTVIVKSDKKIKPKLKQNLLYTLNGIIYSTKYQDVKLIATQLNCFDYMSKKVKSIQLIYSDLKAMLKNYFNDNNY